MREIVKLIERHRYERDTYTLFSDVCSTMAYSLSNAVDLGQRDEREKRYMDIIGRYDRDTTSDFPKVLAHVTMALQERPGDVLGTVFQELELGNKDRGQFFTPYDLSRLIAEMSLDGKIEDAIAMKGFATIHEPAVGSGSMVIALAEAMRERGVNYQKQLHVTAVDVDERAAHMAYVQFSLLDIPAEVIVGNTLTGEVRDRFFTPVHIWDGWTTRLNHERAINKTKALTAPEAEPVNVVVPDIEVSAVTEQLSLLSFEMDGGGMDL